MWTSCYHQRLRNVGLDIEDRTELQQQADQCAVRGRHGPAQEGDVADGRLDAGHIERVFDADGQTVQGAHDLAVAGAVRIQVTGALLSLVEKHFGQAVKLAPVSRGTRGKEEEAALTSCWAMAARFENARVTSRAVNVPAASWASRSTAVCCSVMASSRSDKMPQSRRSGVLSRLSVDSSDRSTAAKSVTGMRHSLGMATCSWACLAATTVFHDGGDPCSSSIRAGGASTGTTGTEEGGRAAFGIVSLTVGLDGVVVGRGNLESRIMMRKEDHKATIIDNYICMKPSQQRKNRRRVFSSIVGFIKRRA